MGVTTGIAWTRSSWSPWIGCARVSPGCDHCYAEALDKRHRYGGATHWGPGVPRHRTSAHYWRQPLIWNKLVERERETGRCVGWHTPGFWPVFPSLCDPFDNEVPKEWRDDFWQLIADTPNLIWLLLTKRIGNASKMTPWSSFQFPRPWPNVWLGASIVNQEEADRDIPKLLATPAVKHFVSYEPALSAVDWSRFQPFCRSGTSTQAARGILSGAIDQIIVGGESSQGGKKARAFDIVWARSTVRQCREAGVACFVKQLGSNPINGYDSGHPLNDGGFKDRAGDDPAEWPEDLRVQEFPKIT